MGKFSTIDLTADAAAEQIRRSGGKVHIDHQTGPYLSGGQSIAQRHFDRLIERGQLKPDADGLFGEQPQTYHLTED